MFEPAKPLLSLPSPYRCVRSFALASQAAPLSRKQEMLIVSRLMNMALMRQDDLFFSFLNDHPDVPLTEAAEIGTKAHIRSFLDRYTVNEAAHQKFMTDSLVVFEILKDWAVRFDDNYQMLSGVGTILHIGTDFIAEREAQHSRRLNKDVELSFYANPFLTVNVASEIYRDILHDAPPVRTTEAVLRTVDNHADKMHTKYKQEKTPHNSTPEDHEAVLKDLRVLMGRVEDRIKSRADMDYNSDDAVGSALRALKDYISPYMLPVERHPHMSGDTNNVIKLEQPLKRQSAQGSRDVAIFHARSTELAPL